MNIDRSRSDFQHAPGDGRGAWASVKQWSRDHPTLSRIVWFAIGIGLLGLLLWVFWPMTVPGGRGFNQGPQPVGVAVAQNGDINVTLDALGTVTPLATATVRPQVGGLLTKLNFTEGQMVKAGDVLAQIDPRPYRGFALR